MTAFAYRFLSEERLTDDHYMHLAWAQQLLLGDRPGRDFVDPGEPLMYVLSASVQYVWPGPFSEVALTTAWGGHPCRHRIQQGRCASTADARQGRGAAAVGSDANRAWLASEAVRDAWRTRWTRPVRLVVAGTVTALALTLPMTAVWRVTRISERLAETRILDGWPKVAERVTALADAGTEWPWDWYWPRGDRPEVVQYISARGYQGMDGVGAGQATPWYREATGAMPLKRNR